MGGMSSQVIWKQPWTASAEATLNAELESIGCSLRELASQHWDPDTAAIGGVRDYRTSYLAPAAETWSSVLLHLDAAFAEPLAMGLSRVAGSAIAFLESDQTTWGYCLFEQGSLIDTFWNMPAAIAEDAAACRGDVRVLGDLFGVSSAALAPYLRHLDTGIDPDTKAFEDDEFTLDNHWVRCDFMRRLGLEYPDPGQTEGGCYVEITDTPEHVVASGTGALLDSPPQPKRPWWKFW